MTSSKPASAPAPSRDVPHGDVRNAGTALRIDWLDDIDRRSSAATPPRGQLRPRTLEPEDRVHRLLRAVRLLDLTSLSDTDTDDDIQALCETARRPIRPDVLAQLGIPQRVVRVAAVCVYDRFVPLAREALEGTKVRVAAVTAGFPRGLELLAHRLQDIEATVCSGADEIDVVITVKHALAHDWAALYHEVRAFREACGSARLKTILVAGELGPLEVVARASTVCMMAGADFIKTSTGRDKVNATLPIGRAMARAIRDYGERSGYAVGLKPAGGIRTAEDAVAWLDMIETELGSAWLTPQFTRLGASTLLRQLEASLMKPDRR